MLDCVMGARSYASIMIIIFITIIIMIAVISLQNNTTMSIITNSCYYDWYVLL